MQKTNSFAYFTILKFLGALLIAVFLHYNDHFLTYLYTENPFDPKSIWFLFSRKSYVFVEMYFILSGILFAYAYEERIQNGLSLKEFFINRVKRLYPLVIVTTLYMYLANYFLYRATGTLYSCGTLKVSDLLFDLFLAGKCIFHGAKTLNAPIWYVSVLMLCYLIAFVQNKLSKNKTVLFCFSFLTLLVGLLMRFDKKQYPFWNEDVARGLIAFFAGLLLGHFMKWLSEKKENLTVSCKRENRYQLCFRLVIFLFLMLSLFFMKKSIWAMTDAVFTSVTAIVVFPLLLLLFFDVSRINCICDTRLFRFLGAISFDIYLWNFPIFITLHYFIVTGKMHCPVTSPGFILFLGLLHIIVACLSHLFAQHLCRIIKGR